MEYLIVPARKKDLPEILQLQKIAFSPVAENHNDYDIPPLLQSLEEIEDEFEKKLFFKMLSGDRIIGSIRGYSEKQIGYIERLIVLPEYQGRRLGKQLMYEFENIFDFCKKFELFTGSLSHHTRKFYEKLGYNPVRYDEHKNYQIIFLEKENCSPSDYLGKYIKGVTYFPKEILEKMMDLINSKISFSSEKYSRVFSYCNVIGTWKNEMGSQPFIGEVGKISIEPEIRIEFRAKKVHLKMLSHFILQMHPYEEPVIDFYDLL